MSDDIKKFINILKEDTAIDEANNPLFRLVYIPLDEQSEDYRRFLVDLSDLMNRITPGMSESEQINLNTINDIILHLGEGKAGAGIKIG
jgi:hypothetical protein